MAEVYRQKPWVRGLVETLTAVNLLRHSLIETKNRQALILLDSALEIGFKNFLTYEKQIKLEKNNPIFLFRDRLHKAIADKTQGLFSKDDWTDEKVWKLIDFYYDARCDLYHEMSEKETTVDEKRKHNTTTSNAVMKSSQAMNAQLRQHSARIDEPRTSSCLVCLTPLPKRFLSDHLNCRFELEDANVSHEVQLQPVELEVRRSK